MHTLSPKNLPPQCVLGALDLKVNEGMQSTVIGIHDWAFLSSPPCYLPTGTDKPMRQCTFTPFTDEKFSVTMLPYHITLASYLLQFRGKCHDRRSNKFMYVILLGLMANRLTMDKIYLFSQILMSEQLKKYNNLSCHCIQCLPLLDGLSRRV